MCILFIVFLQDDKVSSERKQNFKLLLFLFLHFIHLYLTRQIPLEYIDLFWKGALQGT